ncbi:LmbU family transcriptional regulator [Streptosporangiaceae bacterium NEAU-GS5]|nr:LmbU family transcriptional regulator [Streptosporangiaceae bacterium NEAU-GS5]
MGRNDARDLRPSPFNSGGPVTLAKTGLIFPRLLPLKAWERLGEELAAISSSSAWWLADWLIYGETAYSGRYRQVVEKTGLSYQTLRNYAWVARRFDLDRRREALSFAHHAEVAALESVEQDYWLRKAEEQGWSRNHLRKQIQASLAERAGGRPAATSSVMVRSVKLTLSSQQLERCEELATERGCSLNAWITQLLESALNTYVQPVTAGR